MIKELEELENETIKLENETAKIDNETSKIVKEYWELKLEMAKREKDTSDKMLKSLGENPFASIMDVFNRHNKEDEWQ